MMRHVRTVMILIAVAACGVAVALWLGDGAWEYGAMPTRGVVRTFLFAGGGCVAFLAGVVVGRYGRQTPEGKIDSTPDD